MKYGETLRQRSIPAWSHHNVDYDDIKTFIKEQTTPGKGKSVSVPGRGDDKLAVFENSLFAILKDQHLRIDLFVKSKAGEIQRRLTHSKKLIAQLAARRSTTADRRIPVGRLERYSRVENDVLKAGEEIKSLARFTSAQRTAFRKLLKKYKKWTGSVQLEDRFRDEVLDDPKDFTKLDLGPLLDDYSSTLQQIRQLYEVSRARQTSVPNAVVAPDAATAAGPSVVADLRAAVESGSKVEFDTAVATVPLSETGTFASYFAHPENLVELQVLLLQHARFFHARSRHNSIASPISQSPRPSSPHLDDSTVADYFAVEADAPERLTKDLGALTVDDREHQPGSTPQKAKFCARWNNDEDASLVYLARAGQRKTATLKRKHVSSFFDRSTTFPSKQVGVDDDATLSLRKGLESDHDVQVLYRFSSSRSRLVSNTLNDQCIEMATLDAGVTIGHGNTDAKSSFPFAVLLVRTEGVQVGGLVAALDQSHLVERVRGFSFEYHAVWETTRSPSIPPPFWLPILSRDIRKLPPPPLRRTASALDRSSGSPSVHQSSSRASVQGVTDSTTAVETNHSDSVTFPQDLETPPLRSFRKKRRRGLPSEPVVPSQSQGRYWSEYDHPEDGSDAENAYVIYIDPNEKSSLDRLFERLANLFRRARSEHEPLLTGTSTPDADDETSSEDESTPRTNRKHLRSYGTLSNSTTTGPRLRALSTSTTNLPPRSFLPQTAIVSFIASIIILAVAYILATTGRHRLAYEVDAGVVLAIVSSLVFAIVGLAWMLTQARVSLSAWCVGGTVLCVDVVGSGGLLAWMLG